jgi:hypothetical protein
MPPLQELYDGAFSDRAAGVVTDPDGDAAQRHVTQEARLHAGIGQVDRQIIHALKQPGLSATVDFCNSDKWGSLNAGLTLMYVMHKFSSIHGMHRLWNTTEIG